MLGVQITMAANGPLMLKASKKFGELVRTKRYSLYFVRKNRINRKLANTLVHQKLALAYPWGRTF